MHHDYQNTPYFFKKWDEYYHFLQLFMLARKILKVNWEGNTNFD